MSNDDTVSQNAAGGESKPLSRTFLFFGGYFEIPEGEDARSFKRKVIGELNPEVEGHTPKLVVFDAITDLNHFVEELRSALMLNLPK